MLALIACHDDAEVLRGSLPRIRETLRVGEDRLAVVADRCTDDSARIAAENGAFVIERRDETSGAGKGGALAFALDHLPAELSTERFIAVFDADSIPAPDFFSKSGAWEAAGGHVAQAAQAEVVPIPGRALLSRVAAYSEIISQRITGRARAGLGWGVPLRGTGMVIARPLLSEALGRCRTQVEDLELTILFAASGIRVDRLNSSVEDPKPQAAAGVASQRARWLAGNFHALVARRREIARLAGSLEGLTLLLWLFCRPRSLFFWLRLALFALLRLFGSGPLASGAELLIALFLARDLTLLFGGLFVVDRPGFYLPAILVSPLYPLIWLWSAARSFGARRKWLSARRPA
jgi:cellulose synthase/poly-beta-1,6-N-acetylglucosamine synthase-like glycosyltransferase